MSALPPVAFLGLAEHAAMVVDAAPNLRAINILGLKRIVVSHIFPLSLKHFAFVFGVYSAGAGQSYKVVIRDESGAEVASVNMAFRARASDGEPTATETALKHDTVVLAAEMGWMPIIIPPGMVDAMLKRPGDYSVHCEFENQAIPLGFLHFVLLDPEPLTAARVAAIRSDATAVQFVRYELKCNECGEALRSYTGLGRDAELEQGHTWYENLPDEWICACGKQRIDLTVMRRSQVDCGRPRVPDTH
jgi:hypothetical protein